MLLPERLAERVEDREVDAVRDTDGARDKDQDAVPDLELVRDADLALVLVRLLERDAAYRQARAANDCSSITQCERGRVLTV